MGFADIGKKKEVDPSVTYNAYSVTKTFTALAVLQLFAKGIIEINKPVIKYLPEFTYGPGITVKELLNHTAGIPNPIPLDWILFSRNKKSGIPHVQIVIYTDSVKFRMRL